MKCCFAYPSLSSIYTRLREFVLCKLLVMAGHYIM